MRLSDIISSQILLKVGCLLYFYMYYRSPQRLCNTCTLSVLSFYSQLHYHPKTYILPTSGAKIEVSEHFLAVEPTKGSHIRTCVYPLVINFSLRRFNQFPRSTSNKHRMCNVQMFAIIYTSGRIIHRWLFKNFTNPSGISQFIIRKYNICLDASGGGYRNKDH